MANSLSNVPFFFSGTYDQLVAAVSPGGQFYPLKKIAYAFVTDRKAIAYCRTDGSITLVGDTTTSVVPEQGTVGDPVILDQLPGGVYSVKGTYQVTITDPPISTSTTQLFIISDTGVITKFSGDSMIKEIVSSSGAVIEEEYVTDADVIRSLASTTDITNLFS